MNAAGQARGFIARACRFERLPTSAPARTGAVESSNGSAREDVALPRCTDTYAKAHVDRRLQGDTLEAVPNASQEKIMRAYRLARCLAPLSVVGLALIACGGEGGSSQFGGASSGGGSSTGTGDLIGLGGSSGDGQNASSGGVAPGEACAAKTANAERKPAHLFFILDQSLSMVSPRPERWQRVTAAFKAFLNDPLSEGVSASLEMFPIKSGNACVSSAYGQLDVEMQPLPGSGPFDKFLNATPNTTSTPTLFVLQSITQMAKAHVEANPDVTTAIVLMTDGVPQGCNTRDNNQNDSIERAASEVAEVKDVVPTYVIGVGSSLDNLNLIAQSGGTNSAFLIDDTNSPESASTKLREAIDAIRGQTLSCELTLPPPPDGETLDLQKVNVSFTTGAGVKNGLAYDEECKAGGWKFDTPTAPTKIVLCPASCDTLKADPKGSVSVEFGCERRVSGVN